MKKYFSQWMLGALALATVSGRLLLAQEQPARQSFGVFGTFAPNSSHIFIGDAEKRRVWTFGLEYGRTLWGNESIRVDYEGSVTPFFQERDPTLIGGVTTAGGYTSYFPMAPTRVVLVNNTPLGSVSGGGSPSLIYPAYGSMKTYAFAVAPLGARVNVRNSRKLQPTFSIDLGVVISSRDLPIDNASAFNYQFSFGPGVEYFYRTNKAIRVEYVYRHLSNANSGTYNPGVDAGVFRLTLSSRHR